jgi:hypothetical protein
MIQYPVVPRHNVADIIESQQKPMKVEKKGDRT